MEIKFSYPHWGSSHLSLEEFITKVKDAGYNGVEMNIPFDEAYSSLLRSLLKKHKVSLIAQQWLPPEKEKVEDYCKKMEKYLYHLASFQPVFINSHTGKDYYSFEENCKIFELAQKVSEETGIKIIHETHRGRALYSTSASKSYFQKFPELRINADFSHWCCVSESLLQEQEDFMNEAIQRSDYLHARVGSEESPQVNHPKAKENEKALKAHLGWWKKIILNAMKSGANEFWICTEFGPEPYLQTLPFTNLPVANQWEINLFMKKLVEKELVKLTK